jgi:hypothetical protein
VKPLLAAGWDLGGWIGPKQGVAVLRFGNDMEWLGTATSFRLADPPTDAGLPGLIRKAWPEASAEVLATHRIVVGVDAPLGYPLAFTRLLVGDANIDVQTSAPEIDNPLAYRATDRWVYRTFGKKPLQATFDKLGNNATVARRWFRMHDIAVLPFEAASAEESAIIEVYPALGRCAASACAIRHCSDCFRGR